MLCMFPLVPITGNVTERGPNAFRLGTRTPTECILVNGTFPGPPLRVTLGDVVRVDVMNTLIGRSINVHWHGFTVVSAGPTAPSR